MTYGGWQEDCQPLPVCMTEKARPSTAPAKLPFSGPHHPDIKKDGRPPVERPSVFSLQIPSLHNAGEQHHVPTVHGTMLQPPRQSASGREPGRERPFLMNVRPQGPLATEEPYGHRQQRATARQPAGLCPLTTPSAAAPATEAGYSPKNLRALSPQSCQSSSGSMPRAAAIWRTVKTVKAGSLRLPRQGTGER